MKTNYRRLAYLASKLDEIIIWDLITECYVVNEVISWKPKKIEVWS